MTLYHSLLRSTSHAHALCLSFIAEVNIYECNLWDLPQYYYTKGQTMMDTGVMMFETDDESGQGAAAVFVVFRFGGGEVPRRMSDVCPFGPQATQDRRWEKADATPILEEEEKKTMAKRKNPSSRPDDNNSNLDAGWWEELSSPKNKKRKKVRMRVSKVYIEDLEKHPPSPPHQPVGLYDFILCDLQDSFVARQTAEREERDRIIKQYKDRGYAYKEFEVTDDENEEA